jgi:predicted NAD-dependent protein-ADP-ribosyltransferase YbiA (DUF1768 family)
MGDVLWHKFIQHDYLRQELLSTGDAELIHVSASFWCHQRLLTDVGLLGFGSSVLGVGT